MLDALHEVPMEQRVAATRLMLNEGLSQLAPRLRGVVGCLAAKAKAGTGNRAWGMEQVQCFRFIDSPKLQISTDDVSFPIPHSQFPIPALLTTAMNPDPRCPPTATRPRADRRSARGCPAPSPARSPTTGRPAA